MQIKYVTEFSWDAKVIGEVIIENEEHIAPGFLKMNSKMYPKNWVLRKMFNENDGEIIIKGEKNILKYNSKDKEYWLINIDEYYSLKYPGARIATDEFLKNNNNAILKKNPTSIYEFDRYYVTK